MNPIVAIPALKDNYIWAIHCLAGKEIVVVDPGEAAPVIQYLKENKLTLSGIVLTHHHWDHTGGVDQLIKHVKSIPVYGSPIENIASVTHPVNDGDDIFFPTLDLHFKVIHIPGHTLGHVAYVSETAIFCGDTLFSCGCGRIFEGTSTQMYHSLEKLKQLSPNKFIYCGHEYTLANIRFAQVVSPQNPFLQTRLKNAEHLLSQGKPSLPVSLAEELKTNPFLRCFDDQIREQVEAHCKQKLADPLAVFTYLRQWKDTF